MSPGAEKFPELCLPSWVEREQTLKWRRELFNNSQIQFPCLRFPNDILSFHSSFARVPTTTKFIVVMVWRSENRKQNYEKMQDIEEKKSDVTQTSVSSIGVTNASSCF